MKKRFYLIILLTLLFPAFVFGGNFDRVSLTISPLINKIDVEPGGTRSGFFLVTNSSPNDVLTDISTVDFEGGPDGEVELLFDQDQIDKPEELLLSGWIIVPEEPVAVPAFSSVSVPFFMEVPKRADPGGKYAAVLVNTKPEESEEGMGSAITFSYGVGSLMLVNVEGDVIEDARLTDFSVSEDVYHREDPVSFSMTVKNYGSVHIQPRGEIRIYDHRGTQVDTIPINRITQFGNILPESQRSWDFTWEGENDIINTGKYEAVLFLDYGHEERKTVTRSVSFWVLPMSRRQMYLFASVLALFLAFAGYRAYQVYNFINEDD